MRPPPIHGGHKRQKILVGEVLRLLSGIGGPCGAGRLHRAAGVGDGLLQHARAMGGGAPARRGGRGEGHDARGGGRRRQPDRLLHRRHRLRLPQRVQRRRLPGRDHGPADGRHLPRHHGPASRWLEAQSPSVLANTAYRASRGYLLVDFFVLQMAGPALAFLLSVIVAVGLRWPGIGWALAALVAAYALAAVLFTRNFLGPRVHEVVQREKDAGAAMGDSLGGVGIVKDFAREASEIDRVVKVAAARGAAYRDWQRWDGSAVGPGAAPAHRRLHGADLRPGVRILARPGGHARPHLRRHRLLAGRHPRHHPGQRLPRHAQRGGRRLGRHRLHGARPRGHGRRVAAPAPAPPARRAGDRAGAGDLRL